jgi:hypothetical protein
VAKLALEYREKGVPVLVIMKNDDTVKQLQQEHLLPRLQAAEGSGGGQEGGESSVSAASDVQVITSALFSESRSRFADAVDCATARAPSGKYRVTVTSPIGGRGQDYRVQDDAIEVCLCP